MSNQKFVDAELQRGESLRQSNQLKSESEIQTIADNYFSANPEYKREIYITEMGDIFTYDKKSWAHDAAKSYGIKLYAQAWNQAAVKDQRIKVTAVKDGVLQTFTP